MKKSTNDIGMYFGDKSTYVYTEKEKKKRHLKKT